MGCRCSARLGLCNWRTPAPRHSLKSVSVRVTRLDWEPGEGGHNLKRFQRVQALTLRASIRTRAARTGKPRHLLPSPDFLMRFPCKVTSGSCFSSMSLTATAAGPQRSETAAPPHSCLLLHLCLPHTARSGVEGGSPGPGLSPAPHPHAHPGKHTGPCCPCTAPTPCPASPPPPPPHTSPLPLAHPSPPIPPPTKLLSPTPHAPLTIPTPHPHPSPPLALVWKVKGKERSRMSPPPTAPGPGPGPLWTWTQSRRASLWG